MDDIPKNNQYRLIWFQHFHKAAGTSIVNLAKANKETLYPKHHNGNPLDEDSKEIPLWEFTDDELTQFIDHCENTGVTFIANEWGAVNFELLATDPRVVLITCLRNPLKRLLSNFYFDYWSGYTDFSSLEQYLNSRECFTRFNYYCRILSCQNNNILPLTSEHFETAKARLAYFDHVVVLEVDGKFSELKNFLGWALETVGIHQNKSSHINRRVLKLILSGRLDLLWRRFSHPKRQPDQNFLLLYQQGNQWDQRLYEYFKNKLTDDETSQRQDRTVVK
ncbi:sulfotransferase family 2 domain-containing protein [Leptothoe sp. ISB3NOV94-8A]